MKNKFSKNYGDLLEVYKNFHQKGTKWENAKQTFDGRSLQFFFNPIKQIINTTKSQSLIDFGCGKGKFYFNKIKIKEIEYNNISEFWKIDDYYLYDPGVKKFKIYPKEKKDGVICVDVVEHITPEDVEIFIANLFDLANKFVFIVIACYPAKKTLPDGRNVHLSIKTPGEWRITINKIIKKYPNISPFIICAKDRQVFETIS